MTKGEKESFVAYLEGLRDAGDRGALAALRRGLGKPPGAALEMHRYVVPWLGEQERPWSDAVHYMVASLFALHPQPGGSGSVGSALARVAASTGAASTERRFVALLNCHGDDLSRHLRQAVSLAKAHEVPIDWNRLYQDLMGWNHHSGYVQRRWARDYWGSSGSAQAEEGQTAVSEAALMVHDGGG